MTPAEVELVYAAMASKIDDIGSEKSKLYLVKLALLLAHELDDVARATAAVSEAADGIEAATS